MNESQVSKRSYDYQAALGEFGQVRESYGRLKALHLFCQTFASVLAQAEAVLPDHLRDLQPENLAPLRFSVRVKGDTGFLFVNNFQDHITVDVSSAMAGRMEKASGLKAELLGAEIIPVDEFRL